MENRLIETERGVVYTRQFLGPRSSGGSWQLHYSVSGLMEEGVSFREGFESLALAEEFYERNCKVKEVLFVQLATVNGQVLASHYSWNKKEEKLTW